MLLSVSTALSTEVDGTYSYGVLLEDHGAWEAFGEDFRTAVPKIGIKMLGQRVYGTVGAHLARGATGS